LEVHIAPQAHALIFGGEDSLGCIANVSATAAKRKAPVISVYLISSNPEQEDKLLRMFKHVPSRIFKLKNTDFFSAEEGLYPTMGVDRCAVLFAARDMYGAPVLTIDGGTAMTYSALDRSGSIIGGGISPGCRLRFQTLHEKTGALPLIDHRKLKRAVENAILSKKPFPFFAKDTEVGIMTSLCSELAGQLRNIVKQFVAAIQTNNAQQSTKETGIESTTLVAGAEDTAKDDSGKEANGPVSDTPAGEVASENDEQKEKKNLKIVLTGGDADLFQKLLKNDASTIVELEPDVSHLPSNIDFHLNRNLAHYGISERLKDICLDRPVTSEEEFRLKMVGLRVAEVAIEEGEYLRGTVLSFTNTAAVDDCTFEVRLDYNGKTQLWPLQKLYGMYYVESTQSYVMFARSNVIILVSHCPGRRNGPL
jgi:pantothenate kinase type III